MQLDWDVSVISYEIFVWTLWMWETEKGSEEIAANPTQRQVHAASLKYRISSGRGHHLKYESVWRMTGTTWGGDLLRHSAALYYNSLPSHHDCQSPGQHRECRISKDVMEKLSAVPDPPTPVQVSEALVAMDTAWKSVMRSGVGYTEHLVFVALSFYLVYLNRWFIWFCMYSILFYSNKWNRKFHKDYIKLFIQSFIYSYWIHQLWNKQRECCNLHKILKDKIIKIKYPEASEYIQTFSPFAHFIML